MTGTNQEEVAEKLFDAVDRDDLDQVKMLVESGGVSLGTINRGTASKKETLAHAAARRGNLDILRYLLEKDSSLVEKTKEGYVTTFQSRTLLETAIDYGHLNVVKYLVEDHNYDICVPRHVLLSSTHPSPVSLAMSKCRLDILKYFIEERGVDVDFGGPRRGERNEWYLSHRSEPLIFTAMFTECHETIIRYLIDERKASLTELSDDDENFLFDAARIGDLNLIKYVLDVKKAPIDVNHKNKDGVTLVYLAVDGNRLDILQYLVEQKKANVNTPRLDNKWTPVLLATCGPNVEIFEYLVDHGADLKARNDDGDTPLHLAAALEYNRSRSLRFCKYLLEHGANLRLKNQKEQTPLDVSLAKLNSEASKCLIDHSGNVNQVQDEVGTIVHKIASHNQTELLDYLVSVKHGDVNIVRKKDQWTPLHCAAASDLPEVCKYLIEHGADPRAKNNEGRMPVQLATKKATIVYLQSAAAERRSRRSANLASLWIPPYHSKPENSAPQVTGNSYEGAIAFSNEMQAFHIHNFLAIANFAIRCLFHSCTRTSIGEITPLGVNHVAEEAINSFIDFEED